MTWGPLSLLEVSFQVQGGCKTDNFWVKIQLFLQWYHKRAENLPGMGRYDQNIYQAMGKGVVSASSLHPGVIPGPGAFKNARFGDKKSQNVPKKFISPLFDQTYKKTRLLSKMASMLYNRQQTQNTGTIWRSTWC